LTLIAEKVVCDWKPP